ncbi:hypothetical protein QL285_060650 [Trifolium repens]|nr:hypothetical protein QL285_060650 [Trifolium repens]
MHDRSKRSSLCGSLNRGRRCINSTALTALFMVTPSIKHLSRLTAPPSNFTPNAGLPISEGNNPSQSLFPSHEDQKISIVRIFKSRPKPGPFSQMISSVLATSLESPTTVPSSRYQVNK